MSMARLGRLGIITAMLIWAAALASGPARAAVSGGPETIIAQAPAGEDQAAARDQAVARAFRQAVGRAVAEMVDPATLRAKLAVLEEKILARSGDFVTNYSVQSQAVAGENLVAMVSVTLDRASLDQALAAAGLRLAAARTELTLVLVSEETAPGRPEVFWWSGNPGVPEMPLAVGEVLSSLGVRTVEPGVMAGKIPADSRQPALSEEEALALARAAGAGLVILGRVRTYPMVTPEGQNPPPVAQLMALDVATGNARAVVEAQGPAFHQTPGPGAGPAVTEAVQAATRELLEEMSSGGPAQTAEAQEVTLVLNGVRSLSGLLRFQETLAGMTGLVESVRRESVGRGKATLRVKLKVPASQLADRLIVQDFGGNLVNVLEIAPGRLELMLIPQ